MAPTRHAVVQSRQGLLMDRTTLHNFGTVLQKGFLYWLRFINGTLLGVRLFIRIHCFGSARGMPKRKYVGKGALPAKRRGVLEAQTAQYDDEQYEPARLATVWYSKLSVERDDDRPTRNDTENNCPT